MKKAEQGAGPGDPVSATPPIAAGQAMAPPIALAAPIPSLEGVKVVPVSSLVKLALPPLLIASLPKRAIGFSFPRGAEGKLLGTVVLIATALIAFLADKAVGPLPAIAFVWVMGGTGVVMLYNSTLRGLAFIKQMCYDCRLRPIIVEHETMHLSGIRSEEEVWRLAKQRHTYDGLGLAGDPRIHSFCPISKRLKDNP